MAHDNGKIFVSADSGISLVGDVKYVLGENKNDLGSLCTANIVNMWSKRKPIHFNTKEHLTDAQLESADWGLYADNEQDGRYVDEIKYDKPRGGESSPYRLLDFDGYVHYAQAPLAPMADLRAVYGDRPTISIDQNTQIDGGITMADLTKTGRLLDGAYLCLLFYVDGDYYYWAPDSNMMSLRNMALGDVIEDQFNLDELIQRARVNNPSNPNVKEDGTIEVKAIACFNLLEDSRDDDGYALPRVLAGTPSDTLGYFYPLPFASYECSMATIDAITKRYVYIRVIYYNDIFVINAVCTDTNGLAGTGVIDDPSELDNYAMGAPFSVGFTVDSITFCTSSGAELRTADINLSLSFTKGSTEAMATCNQNMNASAYNALKEAYNNGAGRYTKASVSFPDANGIECLDSVLVGMDIQ